MRLRLTFIEWRFAVRAQQYDEDPGRDGYIRQIKNAGLKQSEIDMKKIGYWPIHNAIEDVTYSTTQYTTNTQRRHRSYVLFPENKKYAETQHEHRNKNQQGQPDGVRQAAPQTQERTGILNLRYRYIITKKRNGLGLIDVASNNTLGKLIATDIQKKRENDDKRSEKGRKTHERSKVKPQYRGFWLMKS